MSEQTDEPATIAADLDPFTAELARQGFAIDGGYPVNHRLRAEALSKAGIAEDPAGHITADMIAATGERLAAEARDAAAAEAAEARETPSMNWNRDRLASHAASLNIEVAPEMTKAGILEAINAAPAA